MWQFFYKKYCLFNIIFSYLYIILRFCDYWRVRAAIPTKNCNMYVPIRSCSSTEIAFRFTRLLFLSYPRSIQANDLILFMPKQFLCVIIFLLSMFARIYFVLFRILQVKKFAIFVELCMNIPNNPFMNVKIT